VTINDQRYTNKNQSNKSDRIQVNPTGFMKTAAGNFYWSGVGEVVRGFVKPLKMAPWFSANGIDTACENR